MARHINDNNYAKIETTVDLGTAVPPVAPWTNAAPRNTVSYDPSSLPHPDIAFSDAQRMWSYPRNPTKDAPALTPRPEWTDAPAKPYLQYEPDYTKAVKKVADRVDAFVVEYYSKRDTLIKYLENKVKESDWHGVSDAANDLRVLEAKNGH